MRKSGAIEIPRDEEDISINGRGTVAASGRSNGEASSGQLPARRLRERLLTKKAVVGTVGLGYVGLPLALEFAANGFRTLGFDVNAKRIQQLNRGENYIQDVSDARLKATVDGNRFTAFDDFSAAGEADVLFICVPTPVTAHKDPDTTYIEEAARQLAQHLREGQLIILKSTTYPTTTEELVLPILEETAGENGLQLGREYFLAFSPERIDPGNQQFTTENTPIVVGGVTNACTELARLVLEQIVAEVHTVSSPRVAEMEKLLENIFRSVNIALVNEMARLCDRMGGVSIWEVVEAAATKPFGFMPFQPGPGLGGHCIPVDPYYLSWLARQYDFETGFITLSARTNEDMPFYVADAVIRAVASQPIALRDAKVLVLGVAFKRDVDDTRHTPAAKVMDLLAQEGISQLRYSDPHVPTFEVPTPQGLAEQSSTVLSEEVLQAQDVVVILTDHSAFPYHLIAERAPSIVDTRNALRHVPHDRGKVILLGGGSAGSARRMHVKRTE